MWYSIRVGRPGSLVGQSKEYPTHENNTSDGLCRRMFVFRGAFTSSGSLRLKSLHAVVLVKKF